MISSANGNAKPDHAAVAEKVLAIVRPKATSSPVKLDDSFDALGLDSLAMAEMVFEVESAFGIHTDERILDVRTVEQLVDFMIKSLRDEKAMR